MTCIGNNNWRLTQEADLLEFSRQPTSRGEHMQSASGFVPFDITLPSVWQLQKPRPKKLPKRPPPEKLQPLSLDLTDIKNSFHWPFEKSWELDATDNGPRIPRKPMASSWQTSFHDASCSPEHSTPKGNSSSLEDFSNITSSDLQDAEDDDEKWQENEIPEALGYTGVDEPEDIRNIVQEALDEHRALRASKKHTQAIVVRTTITMSTAGSRASTCWPMVECSVMSANRAVHRSVSSKRSESPSESSSSVGSTVGDQELRNLRTSREQISPMSSHESLSFSPKDPRSKSPRKRERLRKNSVLFKLPGLTGRRIKKIGCAGVYPVAAAPSECISCFDEMPNQTAVDLPCQHQYCAGCFSQLVSTALLSEDTFPPKCCLKEIPRGVLQQHLSPAEMLLFHEKALEYKVPMGSRYYCASPECAKWINTRKARRTNGGLECPHCQFQMCTICRCRQHGRNQDCPQDFGLGAALEQAERAGWRRCYGCRTMVELNTGCRHITCKCKAQFCYTCGAKWRTCTCTEADQDRREAEIAARLESYNAEVRAEEAEVRAAIAAVEAAERQVAQEREAEERAVEEARRTAEAEEATKTEIDRVEGISDHFQQLRRSLRKVDLQQKQAIATRHEMVDLPSITRMKADLASADMYIRRVSQIVSQRAEIVANNERKTQELSRRHEAELAETINRHRGDQDIVFLQPIRGSEVQRGAVTERVLALLMAAQDAERRMLASQQDRELRKWEARGNARLEEFDEIMGEEKARFEKLHIKRTDEIKRALGDAEAQVSSDWKWYDALVAAREAMLDEDENRMIRLGADVL